MFKKIVQSLSKSLSHSKSTTSSRRTSEGSVLEKITKGQKADPSASPAFRANATPEELCEITAKMTKSEIHARLKLLYRRYNRAASSLDARMRSEADRMLDAIVTVRQKHLGGI